MSRIPDPSQQFIPKDDLEYVALQLAIHLKDQAEVSRYIQYVSQHRLEDLFRLFHRVRGTPEPARAFHASLMPSES